MGDNSSGLDLVMLDDGFGLGDMIACCPICKTPFTMPMSLVWAKEKPKILPCNKCGTLLKVPKI